MNRRRFLQAAGVGAGSALLGSCTRATTPAPPRWMIVVTIDTLRADHLACYGYPRITSPFLDGLAKQGVLFERAFAATSLTNPSHVSLFTSLELPQHKVYGNMQSNFDGSIRTLAQIFEAQGYDTAAFTSIRFLRVLRRGFRTFNIPDPRGRPGLFYRPAEPTVAEALAWLESKHPDDKLFLWVHLYDPHAPYQLQWDYLQPFLTAPPKTKTAMFQHWTQVQGKNPDHPEWNGAKQRFSATQCSYDAEIAAADFQLKRLFEESRRRGPRDATAWVVTSDHGEGLGNHDDVEHGKRIYNEQLHVPLILWLSSGAFAGRRVPALVRHMDLLPTLADLSSISLEDCTQPMQGESLLPMLHHPRMPAPRRTAFAHRRRKSGEAALLEQAERGDVFALQTHQLKYIHHTHGAPELYDLEQDPLERTNVFDRMNVEQRALADATLAKHKSLIASAADIVQGDITDEHKDELEALGYV